MASRSPPASTEVRLRFRILELIEKVEIREEEDEDGTDTKIQRLEENLWKRLVSDSRTYRKGGNKGKRGRGGDDRY